ncbi:MAG: hypothetical protein CR982_07565 [Candidatus Cloacimonadota bacterium]|nr:MAG: hypothetical protein CR982_07565 [Candidatus Cloacimonadota bacterium]PIE80188.1 MAG: hypothetical protein CSA15_02210 [Candidatus Delongbacteria bacterium]
MKVCVVNLLRLGDLLQSLPLIEELSKRERVTFFIPKLNVLSFLKEIVDCEIVELDIDGLLECSKTLNFDRFSYLLGKDRASTFDYAINLNSFELSFYISSFFGKKVLGVTYDDRKIIKDKQFSLLFNSADNRKKAPINISQLYLSYLENIENIPVAKNSRSIKNIVINVNTGSSIRNFPNSFYINLIENLKRDYNLFLVGTDIDKGNEIYSPFTEFENIENLTGKQSLKELYQLLVSSDLLISPDTATIHMAARTEIKILGLYNISAYYFQTAPFSDAIIYIPNRGCYPCNEDFQPCGNRECMWDYSGFKVAEIVRKFDTIPGSERLIRQRRFSDGSLVFEGGNSEEKSLNNLLVSKFLRDKSGSDQW